MWVICISLTATNTYVYLYSQILWFTPNDADNMCRYSSSLTLNNISTMFERMIQYVLWLCPVIYVFWP